MTIARATPAVTFSVIFIGLLTPSDAHRAITGWTYPPACCRGNNIGGDCDAIPSRAVRKGPDGFLVRLRPGDHHLATRNHAFFIPYGNEISSGDGNYHICLHPTEDSPNCFFAPPDSALRTPPVYRQAANR